MKEKEYRDIKRMADSQYSAAITFESKIELDKLKVHASINRQLTRIADVMEDKYRKKQSNVPTKAGD